jgi:hypothetical protein
MPSAPLYTRSYIESLKARNSKILSATLRYYQRRLARETKTLAATIVSLYEENKAPSGENSTLATKLAHRPSIKPKNRLALKPTDRRPARGPTEIIYQPGNAPIFGAAIDEYGTNFGSSFVANLL